MTLDPHNACEWCGHFHDKLCPQVKRYEFKDGQRVAVEFFAPVDHLHPDLLEAARKIVEQK
jgi:hypothetical protein